MIFSKNCVVYVRNYIYVLDLTDQFLKSLNIFGIQYIVKFILHIAHKPGNILQQSLAQMKYPIKIYNNINISMIILHLQDQKFRFLKICQGMKYFFHNIPD